MDDRQLIDEYAVRNSDEAFRQLTQRHAGIVYHSALRQLRDPHIAEEITQAVFIALARKAANLPQKTVLSGWLIRATRMAVLNHIRHENRRRRHEQEAQAMEPNEQEEADSIWNRISPYLDEALNRLSQTDRQAIVSRFFENKSHKEVGEILGMSEETARRRVSRAIEKLRTTFARRGIVVPAVALLAALGTHGIQSAPSGLASSLAVTAVKASSGKASSLAAAKGILKLMAWAKLKAAAITGGVALLTVGTAAVIIAEVESANLPATRVITAQVVRPDGTPAAGATVFSFVSMREHVNLSTNGDIIEVERLVKRPDLAKKDPFFADGLLMARPDQKSDPFASHPDAKTDANGRFSVTIETSPDHGRNLVIVGDDGCSQVAISNLDNSPIKLQPWSKVTGRLLIGATPGTNMDVMLIPFWADYGNFSDQYPGDYPSGSTLRYVGEAVTDENGRYAFSKVSAGDHVLGYKYQMPPSKGPEPGFGWRNRAFHNAWVKQPITGLTQTLPLHVGPGEAITQDLGGKGRTVVGKVTPGKVGLDIYWKDDIYYLTRTVPLPPGFNRWNTNEVEKVRYKAWHHSPEGRAADWQKRQYAIQLEEDGSFLIQDVPPGEYDFCVWITKMYGVRYDDGQIVGNSTLVAAAAKHIVVPASGAEDVAAAPIDAGQIDAEWVPSYLENWFATGQVASGEKPTQLKRPLDPAPIAAMDAQLKDRQSHKDTNNEFPIDLSRYVTAKLTEPLGEDLFWTNNNLAALPTGVHVFGGVPFNIKGTVQLISSVINPYVRSFPESREGIAIGRKITKLHLLHGVLNGPDWNLTRRPPPGFPVEPVAKLVLHYADGTQSELPIVDGKDVMPILAAYVPRTLSFLENSAELAWVGTNPHLKDYEPATFLHLYRTTWQNPKPDVQVTAVDYVSTMTKAAPLMAGLTVE